MGLIRWRAVNKSGTTAYYCEPYTVQHFTDALKDQMHLWFVELPQFLWKLRSKKGREQHAHAYNEMMFGGVPDNQVMVFDNTLEGIHPMTANERRKWFGR